MIAFCHVPAKRQEQTLRYDLKSLQWRPAPMHRSADWRGNAAGWVWGDELWVHGGHHDSNEPQNILLPLLTGPSKLLRRTVQSISATWLWDGFACAFGSCVTCCRDIATPLPRKASQC